MSIDPVNFLPSELSFHLFTFLEVKDVNVCFQVSKPWNYRANDHLLEKAILPKEDIHTKYDYDIGEKRRRSVQDEKVQISVTSILIDQLGLHWSKLCIKGPEEIKYCKNYLPKELTEEFLIKNVKNWGKKYCEKIMSSSETGSLYWHMIHHFGSFEYFLKSHGQSFVADEDDEAPKKKKPRLDQVQEGRACISA